jgi:hypothetical protein
VAAGFETVSEARRVLRFDAASGRPSPCCPSGQRDLRYLLTALTTRRQMRHVFRARGRWQRAFGERVHLVSIEMAAGNFRLNRSRVSAHQDINLFIARCHLFVTA